MSSGTASEPTGVVGGFSFIIALSFPLWPD